MTVGDGDRDRVARNEVTPHRMGQLGQTRRTFVAAAAAAIAAAKAGLTPATAATDTSSHANLGPIKQIDAGVLNIGYAEVGSAPMARR